METEEKSGSGFGAKVIAVVVLGLAAYFLFHIVLGFLTAVGGFILAIAAVIAAIWAIRVLF